MLTPFCQMLASLRRSMKTGGMRRIKEYLK
jgi:hypothetical protein